jgi:putative pyruvate formate lyase activating enzyme
MSPRKNANSPVESNFRIKADDFSPAYLALHRSGELRRRAEEAAAGLARCEGCPRHCDVNRLAGETGVCRIGRYARAGSCFPHHGEEDCLRGWAGSGTIFFQQCNLRCIFCQNYDISQSASGEETMPDRLAAMMLDLQARGCHNINLVTPSHVVPQILEVLPSAVERGLRLPIVYNTSAYDSLENLRLLDGIVDIYMPDFKFWSETMAEEFLHARDYPEVAREAIREMHRQVGELKLDEFGLARRGVLVRHLVMPDGVAGTQEIMEFLAREISSATFVNVMAQYHPAGKVGAVEFARINRRITPAEYDQAQLWARGAGLFRFDG